MGIHYDYKSTKGNKLMEKQAKREKKLAEKKAKREAKGSSKTSDKPEKVFFSLSFFLVLSLSAHFYLLNSFFIWISKEV